MVSWDSASFSLVNMSVIERPLAEICEPFKPGSVIFPEKKTFQDHVDLCYQMRGRPTVIRSEDQLDELTEVFFEHFSLCEGN